MKTTFLLISAWILLILNFAIVGAQTKYSHTAQKQLIPAELGQSFLGMSFRDFAKNLNFKDSEADDRFGWLEVKVPFRKGNAESLFFKVHGLSNDETTNLIRAEKIVENKGEVDEYEREVKRLDASKISAKGIVYEINIKFKDDFDLKNYALKKYGKPADQSAAGIYDLQWSKKTADNLAWLIRYHESAKTLQLIGIIKKTEWDPKA